MRKNEICSHKLIRSAPQIETQTGQGTMISFTVIDNVSIIIRRKIYSKQCYISSKLSTSENFCLKPNISTKSCKQTEGIEAAGHVLS